MIETPLLNRYNIFPVDAGKDFDLPEERVYLVYSPCTGHMILAQPEEVMDLENYAAGKKEANPETEEVFRVLKPGEEEGKYGSFRRTVADITKLSILPNYICNFSCSYCFSAQGRSSEVIEIPKVKEALDYFIDRQRTDRQELWIAILGGGEPMLSWEVVAFIIKYSRERAEKQGFGLGIGLTTNGSVIEPEMLEVLREYHVHVGVSFEVLERIQNLQRRRYQEVCRTIDRLVDSGIDVTLKSIITTANVRLLEETVEELHNRFPAIKKLKLQPVEDDRMFPSVDELAAYYVDFSDHFFPARVLGERYGIDVYCLPYKYVDLIQEHYCGGEMCLTPKGTISVCHRISSPREKYYEEFVYGDVTGKGVEVDEEKLERLMAHNLYNNRKCDRCFVRWHCGGGCLAQARTYDEKRLNVICEWTRDFTRRLLVQRLDKQYRHTCGCSLKQLLNESK